jgi:uncharacterized protein
MKSRFTLVHVRELTLTVGPAVLLVAATLWVASRFVEPGPPQRMIIAAASKGSPYYRLAEQYRQFVAQSGISLEVRETSGSIENLGLLQDPNSGVALGFLQGGVANTVRASQLQSIGRLFYEPVWVFYHGDEPMERLTQLSGKRILVGPPGSGTNQVATKLLTANGVTAATARLINMDLPDYVEALGAGRADAGFLVLAPEANTISRLFNTTGVRLMNLTQADAYVQRFPFLTRLELKQGVVDFARNIPSVDTKLVATTAVLVVRADLHPALVNLITQAVVEAHARPAVDADGEAPLFSSAGAFPVSDDPEFPLASEARRVYKSGPPLLQRYLPFWLATLIDRLVVFAVPFLGLGLPLIRFVPLLYVWRVRRRILHWYGELKRVENTVSSDSSPADFEQAFANVDGIEAAVDRISIPLGFSNQLYDLREHIDVVRRRLAAMRAAVERKEGKRENAGEPSRWK